MTRASPPPGEGDSAPPAVDGTLSPGRSGAPAARPSRTRRAVASAAVARDRTIGHLVTVLVPLIRSTRVPLLLVVLTSALPGLLLIMLALLRPGPDDAFGVVVGTIGLAIAGWLAIRRRQLLTVAADPAVLANVLASAVTGRDVWEQVAKNLTTGRSASGSSRRRSRPLRLLRGMWRGIRLTGILQQLIAREELRPLMPGRLRGLGILVLACLIAGLVLSLAILIAFSLYLLGA